MLTHIEIGAETSLMEWLKALEQEMCRALGHKLDEALKNLSMKVPDAETQNSFFDWLTMFPIQIVILSIQTRWTYWVELALKSPKPEAELKDLISKLQRFLNILAESVLEDETDKINRTKIVQIITETIHQRDVCQILVERNVSATSDFTWLGFMRFYYK